MSKKKVKPKKNSKLLLCLLVEKDRHVKKKVKPKKKNSKPSNFAYLCRDRSDVIVSRSKKIEKCQKKMKPKNIRKKNSQFSSDLESVVKKRK